MLCSFCQCVEEILGYLKSCFSREPTMATVCVQQVSNIFIHVFVFWRWGVGQCGSRFGSSTEQCVATCLTPHRVILVPADRACKGIGFPVRWLHTYLYVHSYMLACCCLAYSFMA